MGDLITVTVPVVITVYTHTLPNGDELQWNVDEAQRIVAAFPREPEWVSPVFQVQVYRNQEVNRAHLKDVNEDEPGIVAPIIINGEQFHVLVDGNHRCVKATEMLKNFSVYPLTPEESLRCLIKGDPKYLP